MTALEIVFIELFAGLLPLATAAGELGVPFRASYASGVSEDALTVSRAMHSGTIELGDVQNITQANIQDIVHEHD